MASYIWTVHGAPTVLGPAADNERVRASTPDEEIVARRVRVAALATAAWD
jgi:hypothetical protein